MLYLLNVLSSWVLAPQDPSFISPFISHYISASPQETWVIFFLCVCVCVSFTLILLFSCPPLFISFHQGRTPTAPIQKASPVVLCLILSVCILPWAQVKPLSELDFKVKADVVVSDGIMWQILHVRTFTGSYTRYGFAELTPTPARAHTRQTSTRSALPSVLCCFIVLCHLPAFFMFPYVFPCSLWAGCKLQNLLLNENDDWTGKQFISHSVWPFWEF